MSITIKLSPIENLSHTNLALLNNIRKEYISDFKLNNIAKSVGLESIETRDKPFSISFLSSKSTDERSFILEEVAKRYFDRVNIRNLLDINDYLIGIAQSIPNGIKANIVASVLMDAKNVAVPLINAYSGDVVEYIKENITDSLLNSKSTEIKVDDVQSYLLSILNAVKENKSGILIAVDNNVPMERFIEIEITRSLTCELCTLNKLLLAIYRNILEILLDDEICQLDAETKEAITKIKENISSNKVDDIRVFDQVNTIVLQIESQSGIALEAFGMDTVKKVVNQIISMFKYIGSKINQFFKMVIGLFRKQNNIKEKVNEEVQKLTPEEKKKAEEAGKPKYYTDSENKKVYAFDNKNNYIVTMNIKSPSPFVRENPVTVAQKVEENKNAIKESTNSFPSMDELIKTTFSKSDTINKDIYNLVMKGKNPPSVILNTTKNIYDYLTNKFNTDITHVMSQASNGNEVFSLDNSTFSNLVKLLDEINSEFGITVEKGDTVIDYVKNMRAYINDNSNEEVKIGDNNEFIQKIKTEKSNASYEEFSKYSSRQAPHLNSSLFNNPSNTDSQTTANHLVKIYSRLCSIYKTLISHGIDYYQLIYIPIAMANNIGEVGEKAAYLYAAKRKDANNN